MEHLDKKKKKNLKWICNKIFKFENENICKFVACPSKQVPEETTTTKGEKCYQSLKNPVWKPFRFQSRTHVDGYIINRVRNPPLCSNPDSEFQQAFKDPKVTILWKREQKKELLKSHLGSSLVAQWLRICLPMQGTRVRALVWEDPTCREAARPVSHNCWACASGARAPQQERPR